MLESGTRMTRPHVLIYKREPDNAEVEILRSLNLRYFVSRNSHPGNWPVARPAWGRVGQ